MIDTIKGWLAPYMLYVKIAAIALLIIAGWYARGVYERAQAADKLQNAIDDHLAAEGKSHGIGLNLETGLNDYKSQTAEIDRKVNHATLHDTGNRFDAAGVQRTSDRIAAGIAARKRGDTLR